MVSEKCEQCGQVHVTGEALRRWSETGALARELRLDISYYASREPRMVRSGCARLSPMRGVVHRDIKPENGEGE